MFDPMGFPFRLHKRDPWSRSKITNAHIKVQPPNVWMQLIWDGNWGSSFLYYLRGFRVEDHWCKLMFSFYIWRNEDQKKEVAYPGNTNPMDRSLAVVQWPTSECQKVDWNLLLLSLWIPLIRTGSLSTWIQPAVLTQWVWQILVTDYVLFPILTYCEETVREESLLTTKHFI